MDEFLLLLTYDGRMWLREKFFPGWLVGKQGFLDEEGIPTSDETALELVLQRVAGPAIVEEDAGCGICVAPAPPLEEMDDTRIAM